LERLPCTVEDFDNNSCKFVETEDIVMLDIAITNEDDELEEGVIESK